MSKVILICGKICCGKSRYAEGICKKYNAVILSIDEIMFALFSDGTNDMHDTYVERAEKYLFNKSLNIIDCGVNVILDWGFWTSKSRKTAKDFYNKNNIDYQFHYIDISDEEWHKRINKRNADVKSGVSNNYFVDEGLVEKFNSLFEKPNKEEMDYWIEL